MDDITHIDFWEHLVEEIAPLLQISKSLIDESLHLVKKHHIDLSLEMDWEKLPSAFREELRLCIVSKISDKDYTSLSFAFLQKDVMYRSLFEKLEAQYARLDKKEVSARALLLNLMQEIMNDSIDSNAMKLSTWHDLFEQRKEVNQIANVDEYVYKKLCARLGPKEEMSIYDFFYNMTSPNEIDKLLNEVKDSLLLASIHRGQTKKRGQGLSRFIIDYVHHWQDVGLMKPLKSVYPFCQCLQRYWNDEINLGTRQGLEATYKQKL